MVFLIHIKELKWRFSYLFISFLSNLVICFYFLRELLFIFIWPLSIVSNKIYQYFIFTQMMDVFFVYLKIILFVTLILVLPIFLIQLWYFFVPGLYEYEKTILYFIFLTFILFSSFILLLVYFFFIPIIWYFFVNFELTSINSPFGVYYEARLFDYINFFIKICSIFICFFQLPLIIFLISFFKFISIENLTIYRHFFIIFFFIIAALISPPDILSQVFFGFCFFILYEISIFYVYFFNFFFKNGY